MKKPKFLMRKRLQQVLLLTLSLLLVIPAFSEIPKGTDRLQPVLKNHQVKTVFLNPEDDQGVKAALDIKVPANNILVIYALMNQSTGFRWNVQGYDKNILEVPEIRLTDACEPCPAPGASVYQRIVLVPREAGNTQIELVYARPWKKNKSNASKKTLNITTKGALKSTFNYTPSKSNAKKVTKADYEVKALPSYFDWRDQDVVTPVKSQGSCGSCWAFGATAGFEAKIKKKDGVERDLAEQFLVSCNEWGMSCAGGWWAHDLWWNVIAPGDKGAGAVYEEDFPYEGIDAECTPPYPHHEQLEGWAYTDDVEDNRWPTMLHDPTAAQIKEKLYEWGPIPTALCTDDWGGYTGGILSGSTCDVTTHIVLITGYDDNNQCWIVKNSWGTDWGEEGYIRIAYGSHLCGQYSTYLMYDKTNPRIILQGEQFYEGLDNDGSIRLPIQINLFDAGNFAVSIGEMTEGTHFSVSGLPTGLTASIEATDGEHAKIYLNGKATAHLNVNDTEITISFTDAAFADHTAAEVENASVTLVIDFFDPYEIVYVDIDDLTVTSSNTWEAFKLQNGQPYGLWYSYYDYENQAGTMTYFLETYTKKVICNSPSTDVLDREITPLGYGSVIDGLADYFVTGGSYGEQHKITSIEYTNWNGQTAYVGIQFNQYGGTCYGWMRIQVNSYGSSVTLLDYAYNEEPYAPILAGYTSEVTLAPVADFSCEVDESYTGIDIQFYDESSRVPDTWSWSFPGASPSTSSDRNPKVSYSNPGTYNVTLTVSNSAGTDSKTISSIITIFEAAPPVADFEAAATTVPLGGKVKFYDLSTNRPTSWAWTFENGDPQTSPDPDAASIFNSLGTHNVSLEVANPFGSDNVTKSVQVVSPPDYGYCSSTSASQSLSISRVVLANLDNSSGSNSTGYENHTSQFASLERNGEYTVEVELNNGQWELNSLGIWIDWNHDGDFEDSNETIHTMNGTQDYDQIFTVPSGAEAGMTVMRVRCHYNKDPFACNEDTYMGETEDYTIIVAAIDDEDPSVPTNLTVGNVTESTIELSWNASTDNLGVVAYDIYNGTQNIASSATNSITLSSLTANTTYTLSVKARDAAGNTSGSSNTVSATTDDIACEYCSLAGGSQNYEWITGVQIGSFSNSSAKENGGYSNFTGQTINLTAGNSVNIELTPNTTQYTEYFVVWIDYNGNCDFTDEGELVFSGGNQGNTTGSISIPSSASGTTRMRIAMSYNSAAGSSCGSFSYGEVEDYTVSFGSIVVDDEAPSIPTNLAGTVTTSSVTLGWTASTDNVAVTGYNVTYNSTTTTVTGTSTTITGLSAGTTYSFTVSAFDAAGNESNEASISLTTDEEVIDNEAPSTPTNLTGSVTTNSVSLSWNASTDNVGVTGYNVKQGGTTVSTVTTASASITGLSAGTTYTFAVSAFDAVGNESGEASISLTTNNEVVELPEYCTASGTNGPEYIAGVQVGSIDNSTSRTSYSDFTDQTTNMSAGNSYAITVEIGDIYSGDAATCWVDWNIDGDFEDSNETIELSISGSTATGTISVPSSATAGLTGLRVRVYYYSAGNISCGTATYGEVEDYAVVISASGSANPLAATKSDMTVFPNPNDGKFQVNVVSGDLGKLVLNLFNTNGQLVLNKKLNKNSETLEININKNLLPGIYSLQVISGNNTITKQVVVK